ncbi:MAG: hypothetical protein IKX90_04170, partial [Verrucomicrobia bacterium]|nr:hypothetical protein [Verrucomicrobiota bacterium]
VHITELPGIRFEETPKIQQAPEPDEVKTESSKHQENKENASHADDDPAEIKDGFTIPDFQVEFPLWISAGWYWFRGLLSPERLKVNLTAIMPILLLFMAAHSRQQLVTILCGCILPILLGGWNWVIMEQFRRHPVDTHDLFQAYGRAPLQLFCLGLINQIPVFCMGLFESEENAEAFMLLTSMILSFFFFYAVNLLVDKRISLLNAIVISVQAVSTRFFPTLLYVFLVGAIAASGVLFFLVGVIFSFPIAYASTVFAYLWVFSRDTISQEEN